MTIPCPPEPEANERAVGSAVEWILSACAARRGSPAAVLIAAGIGGGKTTAGFAIVKRLRAVGVSVGGVLAPRRLEGATTVGYDVLDVATGVRRMLAELGPGDLRAGRFRLDRDGLAFAHRVIEQASGRDAVVIVDEVGRLELSGRGHAPAVRGLIASTSLPLLLVRDTLVDEVVERFSIGLHRIIALRALAAG